MSKKKKNNNTDWRAFNVEMPEALIPVYDFLNSEFNKVLSNNELMEQIKQVNIDLLCGDYWREIRKILGYHFKEWELGANAWYARMLYENIRRVVKSGVERRIIHEVLNAHNNETTQAFWDELHERRCYPAYGVVRNVKREISNGSFTEMPDKAIFSLDYTVVSDSAIERKINSRQWLFRLSKKTWIDLKVCLPKSLRRHATGRIAKPRFIKRKSDGKYIGVISYEVKLDDPIDSEKILGVDLGKVKPFSASAVDENGHVSCEYLVSKKVNRLIEKFDCLEVEIVALVAKQARCVGLEETGKYFRREYEIECLRRKRRNLRTEIVRLLASDIVAAALVEDCGEIHLEDLSWLDACGGRWNHAEIVRAVQDLGVLFGLKVCRVDATYSSVMSPFDGELGAERDRDVAFSDGWVIDRDVLASVNLAVRVVGKRGSRLRADESFKSSRPCARRVKRVRRECLSESGAVAGVISGGVVDYSEFFGCGGVDVVAFSVGVGSERSLPANSITVMANTKIIDDSVKTKHKTSNRTQ